jgi:hypothetical protein
MVETEIDEDPVEPGRESRAPLEAARALVETDEGVLGQIPRVLGVPQDRPRDAVGALLVSRHQNVEGRVVTVGHSLTQRFIGRLRVVPAHCPLIVPDTLHHEQGIRGGAGPAPDET